MPGTLVEEMNTWARNNIEITAIKKWSVERDRECWGGMFGGDGGPARLLEEGDDLTNLNGVKEWTKWVPNGAVSQEEGMVGRKGPEVRWAGETWEYWGGGGGEAAQCGWKWLSKVGGWVKVRQAGFAGKGKRGPGK